jgi:pantoate kinase
VRAKELREVLAVLPDDALIVVEEHMDYFAGSGYPVTGAIAIEPAAIVIDNMGEPFSANDDPPPASWSVVDGFAIRTND